MKTPGFADQRPAIRREDARAAVREVLQREEVLELVARSGSTTVGALRLELAQPVERALEAVDAASTGCRSPSATMPKLVLPEPSGISQTQ